VKSDSQSLAAGHEIDQVYASMQSTLLEQTD
jgi:hypothetical protein